MFSSRFGTLSLLVAASVGVGLGEGRLFDVELAAGGEIERAAVGFYVPAGEVRAVVVLCPGQNGDGGGLVRERAWRDFADAERVVLAGVSFSSLDGVLAARRGYFVASRGSGRLLERALSGAGFGDFPLFLHGFSGGAHFAATFASWRPERVRGLSVFSFAWWSPPAASLRAPAVVACGQHDGARYGSTLAYFQAGRRAGKPWVWVSLGATAHEPSVRLEDFVRAFFREILNGQNCDIRFVDNLTGRDVEQGAWKSLSTSVLPSGGLLPLWRSVHAP